MYIKIRLFLQHSNFSAVIEVPNPSASLAEGEGPGLH